MFHAPWMAHEYYEKKRQGELAPNGRLYANPWRAQASHGLPEAE